MPGFDGTGPRGIGPITGKGMGYCAIRLPRPRPAIDTYGERGNEPAYLREEAQVIREQIKQIEARIKALENIAIG